MTPLTVGLISMGVLLVLLFSGMPVGFVMGLVGFAGFAYIKGFDSALAILQTVPFRTYADYGLSVIPLFVLMGSFAFYAGISKDLYDAVHKWLGSLPGGLGMATIGACAIFSSVSGSSVACAATFGKVTLPEMKRYNYDAALATGSVAAGGTLDILIPPSVMMIIYCMLTDQSIGKLFIAGFVPGAILAFFYFSIIYVQCKRNSLLAPRGPATTWKAKIASLKGVWMTLLLFVAVIGGLYFGVFSPTEAAGVGAFGAFIFGVVQRKLNWQGFKESLMDTGKTTAMIFIIITGAMIFNYFLAVSRLPFYVATVVGGLEVNRYLVLAGILVLYIVLGALMDELAMVFLTVPIFYPLIINLGFDPIWFGIVIIMMCVFGMIAPPVGMIVYILKGVAPDIPMFTIYRGALPFFAAAALLVVLMVAFPQIILFIPGLMK